MSSFFGFNSGYFKIFQPGVEITEEAQLLTNNTFFRSTGQNIVALIFLCHWKSGEAKPLEDTLDAKWITEKELKNMEFAPNVKTYIQRGFGALTKDIS